MDCRSNLNLVSALGSDPESPRILGTSPYQLCLGSALCLGLA